MVFATSGRHQLGYPCVSVGARPKHDLLCSLGLGPDMLSKPYFPENYAAALVGVQEPGG